MQKKTKANVRRLSPSDIDRELKAYEAKFGMSTSEFLSKWELGEMGDGKEVFKWRALVHLRDGSSSKVTR